MNKKKEWYIGGSSGGHIFPLVTLIFKSENTHILFLPKNSYICEITKDVIVNKIYYHYIQPSRKIFQIFFYFLESFFLLFFIFIKAIFQRPSIMVSTGGYFSLPFFFVSKLLLIPFHLYHLDSVPGKAAKLMSCFPNLCNPIYEYYIYEDTLSYCKKKNNIIESTYPIKFTDKDRYEINDAKKKLKINSNKKVVFILGGSQGAEGLNNICMEAFLEIPKFSEIFYVIHQIGKLDRLLIEKFYYQHHMEYFIFNFDLDLSIYYSAADIIICRCGAGTLAEVVFFKKKTLLSPLVNQANNHQIGNALAVKKKYKNIYIIAEKKDIINLFIDENGIKNRF